MTLLVYLLSVLGVVAISQATVSNDPTKAMEDNQIVPDVIDVAPQQCITITFPSGAVVNQGDELTPTQVKDVPNITYAADDNAFYTLLFVDPDAPSRATPLFREVRHWAVVNIPGNKVQSGETLVEHIGSGPPQGTGLHRYVFLVFKQNGKLTFDEPHVSNRSREGRLKTSARDFVKKYNLGNPIAGNFYQAQYDDYVPILHAQLA